jgi:hypothetical protein
VLKLCDRAGLVNPGVVSIDGTRIAGNASPEVNHTFDQIAREVLAEVRATDEAEDAEFGEARGDELPEQLRTEEGRREFFRPARQQTCREQGGLSRAAGPRRRRPTKCRLSSMRTTSSGAGAGGGDGMRGCGRASASSSSTGGRGRTRSRAVGRAGCCWPPSDWNQTTTSSAVPMPPMSITGRPRATGWVGI